MIYYILSSILIGFAVYNILTNVLYVPGFKTSKYIQKINRMDKPKSSPLGFIVTLSKPYAKYIPLSLAKEINLEKQLQGAQSSETPHEFVARLSLSFLLICLLAIPLAFIFKWLAFLPPIFAVLFVVAQHGDLQSKSKEHRNQIEREIPRLIENFTHSIKTNRNIINIFETYINNYDSYLSRELAKTVADMRTGSQEVALQRFEMRMNNPLISQLIRGILSTLQGDDMTQYYNDLVVKVGAIRRNNLTEQALRVKPKISKMSTVRAMISIVILITVLIATVTQLKIG